MSEGCWGWMGVERERVLISPVTSMLNDSHGRTTRGRGTWISIAKEKKNRRPLTATAGTCCTRRGTRPDGPQRACAPRASNGCARRRPFSTPMLLRALSVVSSPSTTTTLSLQSPSPVAFQVQQGAVVAFGTWRPKSTTAAAAIFELFFFLCSPPPPCVKLLFWFWFFSILSAVIFGWLVG